MAVLARVKSLSKRPKPKGEAKHPKPEAKAAEEKAPQAGEKKAGKDQLADSKRLMRKRDNIEGVIYVTETDRAEE